VRQTDDVRKQYNFWPGPVGLDAWDVDRLVALSGDLPVRDVLLSSLADIDSNYWYGDAEPTVRSIAEHVALVAAVDAKYPIILASSGRVMDGMHRIVAALVRGDESIAAVRFDVDPEPDYRDCSPDDLPY